MFLALLLSGLAQGGAATADSAPVPWVVVEDPDHEPYDNLINPQLIALADGVLVASFQHSGHYRAALGQHFLRSEDRGRTWKGTSVIKGIADAAVFVHENTLWLIAQDSNASSSGPVTIRRSTDGGATWTTPASEATGILRGRGLDCSIASPAFSHGGRIWRPFTHFVVYEGQAHHSALVASADLGSDLLQASSWRWTSELPLSFQPASYCSLVEIGDEQRLALMVSNRGDGPSVSANVSADGWSLVPMRTDDQMSLPETASGARVLENASSERRFALSAEEIAVVSESESWRPRNVLSLRESTFLISWKSAGDLLHDPGGTRYSFAWSDGLADGEDLLVLLSVTLVGDKEAKRPWGRKIVFLRVPKFRERTASSPPLWGPPVPR